jgi:hypothetical protein
MLVILIGEFSPTIFINQNDRGRSTAIHLLNRLFNLKDWHISMPPHLYFSTAHIREYQQNSIDSVAVRVFEQYV